MVRSLSHALPLAARGGLLALLPLALAGCLPTGGGGGGGGVDDTGPGGDDTGDTNVGEATWYGGIQPLVMENCAGCHFEGSILSEYPFDTYESAKGYATWMRSKIEGDPDNAPFSMPPFPPPDEQSDCEIPGPLRDDTRLNDAEKALFNQWVEDGMPEGDPENALPYEVQAPPVLEGAGVVVYPGVNHEVPSARYDASTGTTDIDHTQCFTIGIDEFNPTLIDAVAVEADVRNPGTVHHVIIATDPFGDSYPADRNTDAFDGQFHDCQSDEIRDTLLLYTYTPGGFPLYFPENSAMEVPAGGRMTFTIHYHRGAENVQDDTTMRIRVVDEEPEFLAYMDRFGAASRRQSNWRYQQDPTHGGWDEETSEEIPFLLHANDPDYRMVWKEDNDFNHDFRLWSVFPHLHYAGASIRISLDHNDGSETCLASIDPFDFNWQLTYVYDLAYDQMPTFYTDVDGGNTDTVVIDCHYNNTMENDRLRDDGYGGNGYEEPIDMVVGENALDEMCVMHYGLLVPWAQRDDVDSSNYD